MKTKKGFTLLETVLAVGILSLLFFLGLNIVTSTQKTASRQSAKTIEQIFQTAATRARDGVNGSAWGVYIPYDEATRSTTEAILFSGISYAARNVALDIVYPISSQLDFTSFKNNPASIGNDHEVVFAYLTGQTSNTGFLIMDFFEDSMMISFSATGLPVVDPL
ncbi:MAG: type II secretion system protein [Candidatus Uhrbacteria bacterium]